MDIASITQILTNRLNTLNDGRIRAISAGDIDQVNIIDKDLLETKNSLKQLAMLGEVSAAAAIANTTSAEIVASGIDAVSSVNQVPTVQGPSAGAVINGYDVSAYATDPQYEQKIQDIVNTMPSILTAIDIDAYIQSINPGSPVTGDMVFEAATTYSVDIPLLVAIMQNDSSFGTAGVGARTNNPGNVGNTGVEERLYPTWRDGVLAVAEWLNRHRSI